MQSIAKIVVAVVTPIQYTFSFGFFLGNLGNVSKEHGETFHQDKQGAW